jgi:hypothetical protein
VDRFSRRTVKVTREHNEECRRLLKLMGIPVVIVRFKTLSLSPRVLIYWQGALGSRGPMCRTRARRKGTRILTSIDHRFIMRYRCMRQDQKTWTLSRLIPQSCTATSPSPRQKRSPSAKLTYSTLSKDSKWRCHNSLTCASSLAVTTSSQSKASDQSLL